MENKIVIFFSSTHSRYFNVWQRCNFSSQRIPPDLKENQKKTVTSFPPLTEPIPNLPKAVYSTAKEEHQTTQITVLPNGLKVASENRFGQFCTIGGELNVIPLLYQLDPRFVQCRLLYYYFNFQSLSTRVRDTKWHILAASPTFLKS